MKHKVSQNRLGQRRDQSYPSGQRWWAAYQSGKMWLKGQLAGVAHYRHKELSIEQRLRPHSLSEFAGQSQVQSTLGVFIRAARIRGDALDHTLLAGPPGLAKR